MTTGTQTSGLTEVEQSALAELEEQQKSDGDEPLFNADDVHKPGAGEEEDGGEELSPEGQAAADAAAQLALENAGAEDPEAVAAAAAAAAAAKSPTAEEQAALDKAAADELAAAEAEKNKKPAVDHGSPLYIAKAPEGFDDKMKGIGEQKAELAKQFDDGDKTTAEYQAELDSLNRQERELERQMDRHKMSVEMEEQRVNNVRTAEINAFLASVDIPYDPNNLKFRTIDNAVRLVASLPEHENSSPTVIMQASYDLCVKEGVLQPKPKPDDAAKLAADKLAADKKAVTEKKKPLNVPQTLASLPASSVSETEENQFAHLNRMNPDQREAAFSKLTPAQQDAYLAAGT